MPRRRIVPDDQLGDERRVPAGQAVLAQHGGQHEVGVGVVHADGLEHVERRQPGGVDAARPGGRGRAPAAAPPAGLSHPRGASWTSDSRRLRRPRVGDDLGELVAVDLPEPGLLHQHRVVAVEVVDGEERQPLVLDQRLLLDRGRAC